MISPLFQKELLDCSRQVCCGYWILLLYFHEISKGPFPAAEYILNIALGPFISLETTTRISLLT